MDDGQCELAYDEIMDKMDQDKSIAPYRALYQAGAVAALAAALIFRRNLDAEWLALREMGLVKAGPAAAPGTVPEWFALLQQQPLLGLTLLNLFDLVNYALVGLIVLALGLALWKNSPSAGLVAAACGLVGVTACFATNQAVTLLSLSRQYAAASEPQRETILAAGQAALAIHRNASYAGQGLYLSLLLVSIAGLILSISMLRSSLFGKGTAITGILANGFQLSYYAVLVFAPALVAVPISISAVFLLAWYLQVGVRLWALSAGQAPGWEQ